MITKKPKLPRAKSQGEEAFAIAWRALGGPEPKRELKFHQERSWRFDFGWFHWKNGTSVLIAVEIEGGTKGRSRHTLHEGFVGDCEKYNAAALMGWRVIRLTPDMIDEAHLRPILEAMR